MATIGNHKALIETVCFERSRDIWWIISHVLIPIEEAKNLCGNDTVLFNQIMNERESLIAKAFEARDLLMNMANEYVKGGTESDIKHLYSYGIEIEKEAEEFAEKLTHLIDQKNK